MVLMLLAVYGNLDEFEREAFVFVALATLVVDALVQTLTVLPGRPNVE